MLSLGQKGFDLAELRIGDKFLTEYGEGLEGPWKVERVEGNQLWCSRENITYDSYFHLAVEKGYTYLGNCNLTLDEEW